MTRALGLVGGLLLLTTSAAARAQAQPGDRPSEADIFDAPTAEPPSAPENPSADPDQPATPATPIGPAEQQPRERARDEAILGTPSAGPRLSEEVAPEDPLRIGGLFYQRLQTLANEGQKVENWSISAPSLLDVYLDARPNERVRAFVLGRMLYDPTLPETATGALGGLQSSGSTTGTEPLSAVFAARTRGPRGLLDQFWVRFDIARQVFVTAGKQHVRWGTARFWMPADFLHVRRRNPLDVFDARVGTSMLKLHVPVESRGWNFYGYAISESTGFETSQPGRPTLSLIAAAGRAEVVLGGTEIGAGAVVQEGRKPKWALDISTGIWDFDVYGELGLRYGSEIDRVRYDPNAVLPMPSTMTGVDPAFVEALWPRYRSSGIKPQAVGGLTYSRKYNDNDVWTIGAEYFYNGLGYDSPTAYPGLVLPRPTPLVEPATFFYLGRHYGALFLTLPAPYNLNYHTFTLSTLGNLSDQSFISRFDYSLLLLTHLRFEAFAAVRYGRTEGEFRFGVRGFSIGTYSLSLAPAMLDLGVALRLSI